jgi:hypothetical protein
MLKSTTLLGTLLLLCALPLPAQRADIGMNLGMPWYDYDPLKLFADAVKQGRGWGGSTQGSPVVTDSNGWPLADCNILVWQDPRHMQGTYRLWFTTQNASTDARTVTVTGGTLGNQSYDAAANLASYTIVFGDTGGSLLRLYFRNTGGGVKNVKLMRPITVGAATAYDTSVTFTTSALTVCRKFSALRFMQVVNALSGNMVANWSDRTRPGYCCQQTRSFGGTGSAGVAWEYVVQLCNQTGTDLYANVQFLATDDYVRQLAILLKNTLDPQRKVYVEYSNELWNGSTDYDMHRNHDTAVAEVSRGGSPLNFDGSTGEWTWSWRRAGKRGKEISDIFRSVFGDSAMMTRVRPLLMTQEGDGQATLSENLNMMLDYYNNPAHVATPHPPNYYFYGAGGSGYYTFDASATTLDQIWTSGDMDTSAWIRSSLVPDISLCATFGLKRVAYEAGTEFTAVNQTLCNTAWYDGRFTGSIIDHHNAWSRYGGDLCVYFSLTGWNYTDLRCSFINDVDSLATPKMRAIDSLNARSPQAVTYGSLPPCSIDGDSTAARFTPLWDPPSNCRPTEWYSYVIRVEQAGTYGVTVDYTAPAAGALALLGDGTQIGTPTLTSGTHTTAKSTVFLEPGLHGIIVRITSLASGRMSINQVNVSVESLAAGASVARQAATAARPTLRCVGGRLVVTPGASGRYRISTITGRVVTRGDSRSASGMYVLHTPGGSARAVLAQ